MNVRKRVLIILFGLTIAQGCILLIFTFSYIEDVLDHQIGYRAKNVAESIAGIDAVANAVERQDSTYLQKISLQIAKTTGARFVVIGDKNGVRLSHPIPERIGKPMKGGDNNQALIDGKSYTSKAIGSLGPSMRGKAPIKNQQGEIVGIISVGFMLDSVQRKIRQYQYNALLYIFLALLITAVASWLITIQIRKSIHGLEPEEISRLFAEQSTTLESMKEGIISVDSKGIITNINRSALDVLGINSHDNIKLRHLTDVISDEQLLNILKTKKQINDREITINNQLVIANQTPIYIDGIFNGAVTSFRLKGELDSINQKLSIVEQQADSLRSQSHEYSNRLQTIAGLITLGETKKALDFIGQESNSEQALVTLLIESINSSLLSGFLIGKHNRAKELGLVLKIDENSQIHDLPDCVCREGLISILGNLVENAYEASLKHTGKGATIQISLSDLGNDLIFEIEDQGPGIPEEQIGNLFKKGISSKKAAQHGYGLWLVKEQLDQCGGSLTIQPAPQVGSVFTIFIPKNSSIKTNNKKHADYFYNNCRR